MTWWMWLGIGLCGGIPLGACSLWVIAVVTAPEKPPRNVPVIGQRWMLRGVGEVRIVTIQTYRGAAEPYGVGYEWTDGGTTAIAQASALAFLASATLLTALPGEQ